MARSFCLAGITMPLDWLLFGNGWGMASPYSDDVFYLFNRRFYRISGGFGAQLHSIEWRAPPAGTTRRLAGRTFRVFQTHRRGPRVEVSWGHAPAIRDGAELSALLDHLRSWGHGE